MHKLTSSIIVILAVLATLAAVACEALGPDAVDDPALIIFYGDTTEIIVPDTVARATPVEASFLTFAGGCTREIARTDLTIASNLAEVRPYNRRRKADVCTDDLLYLVHRVTLQFEQPGISTIRVVAEQRPFEGSGLDTGPAQLERDVTVR